MKRLVHFIGLGIISSLVLLLTAFAYSAQNPRTALVIGNARYKQIALRNPVNDATDMAAALKKFGFTVTLITDASFKKMERSVRDFGKQLRRGGVGLFYYAGHGLQVDGRNYLIPIDAVIETESDVKYESVDVGRILGKMKDARNNMNIIILDACRDNPFGRGFRSYTRGLARIDAPSGSILAYATAPGDVAADGSGRNGLYTSMLLQHMTAPGKPIEQVFKNVRKDVVLASDGRQIPWESSSLIRDFYFVPHKDHSMKAVTKSQEKTTPPKIENQASHKQTLASIAPTDRQPTVSLRREAIENLGRNSIENMIYKYNFFENSINRNGGFQNKFIDNHDGTVTDMATGLMWQKGGSSKPMSFFSTKRYINYLNKNRNAGYSDWRLPTAEELLSIIQNNKPSKKIYRHLIFGASQYSCWTNDGYPMESMRSYWYEGKWIVDFKTGSIMQARIPGGKKTDSSNLIFIREKNFVKAVRSAK